MNNRRIVTKIGQKLNYTKLRVQQAIFQRRKRKIREINQTIDQWIKEYEEYETHAYDCNCGCETCFTNRHYKYDRNQQILLKFKNFAMNKQAEAIASGNPDLWTDNEGNDRDYYQDCQRAIHGYQLLNKKLFGPEADYRYYIKTAEIASEQNSNPRVFGKYLDLNNNLWEAIRRFNVLQLNEQLFSHIFHATVKVKLLDNGNGEIAKLLNQDQNNPTVLPLSIEHSEQEDLALKGVKKAYFNKREEKKKEMTDESLKIVSNSPEATRIGIPEILVMINEYLIEDLVSSPLQLIKKENNVLSLVEFERDNDLYVNWAWVAEMEKIRSSLEANEGTLVLDGLALDQFFIKEITIDERIYRDDKMRFKAIKFEPPFRATKEKPLVLNYTAWVGLGSDFQENHLVKNEDDQQAVTICEIKLLTENTNQDTSNIQLIVQDPDLTLKTIDPQRVVNSCWIY